jgi:hypothetical protein
MNTRSLITTQIQDFLFDHNDELTRQRLSDQLVKVLTASSSNRFTVICDETNNPPSIVDKNMLQCMIREKTQHPEEIRYYFKVTPTNLTIQ